MSVFGEDVDATISVMEITAWLRRDEDSGSVYLSFIPADRRQAGRSVRLKSMSSSDEQVTAGLIVDFDEYARLIGIAFLDKSNLPPGVMIADDQDLERPLPADVDPRLWFVSPHARCRGGRDYLFDKHWLTHPGRMAAYCPHDVEWPDYRISLGELPDDLPEATRYWVRGFLAGNLPPAPIEKEPSSPELEAWTAAAEHFARTGEWSLVEAGENEDEEAAIDEDDGDDAEWHLLPDGTYVRATNADD